MTAENLKLIYKRDRLAKRSIIAVSGLLALYLYLGSSVAFQFVARQVAQDELAKRESVVTALETEYLALAGTVTPELALARGFHDAGASTVFVRVPAASGGPVALSTVSR